MKILTVCVLSWAMMAQTRTAENSDLVKRYLFCSSGWTKISGACFYYVNRPVTWAKAEMICQSLSAHLASVHSIHEYHEIQKLTSPYGNKETWIGGSDAQQENVWFWIDGEKFLYTNWCKGEPTKGLQHCLQINHTAKKCWDNLECQAQRPFVCVKRGWGVVGG
ncbi:galactose-specific lectin nattectin-like isoform X2 [Channa argus]|uniref:galactose-specific lectin nattectin-like isoform X2 n=1 Tax=Channa argus TaxID=215402 RepID=UPI003520AB2F